MSRRLTRALIVLGTVLVLGGVDYEIYGKERVIRDGQTVYLEIAPVDPRSLMQGDYMALDFRLAGVVERWREAEGRARRRSAPLSVDGRGVATLGGDDDSLQIAFRIRGGRVWLGTNAYFFTEGTGERYASARYGEFRIDPSSGEAVLVGLRDAELNPL